MCNNLSNMKYNFDSVPCRKGTACIKFDENLNVFGRDDIISMWIADMDFEVMPEITEAVIRRANHKVYGYGIRPASYFDAIVSWQQRRHNWKVESEWLGFSPGVVAGFAFAIRALTNEGDGVVIQPPVYPPFADMINQNNRRLINNPMKIVNGRFEIDFEDLDRKLEGAKALLFCSPHNPTGRVFSEEELLRVGELCRKHDVKIISDEIHADLIIKPNEFRSIASLNDDLAHRTITLTAPSKTFNIAGLATSVTIIPDEELRAAFNTECDRTHAGGGNIFGTAALEVAYNEGEEWLNEVMEYIAGNIDYVGKFLEENCPKIRHYEQQGTFLMWLDCRDLGMDHEAMLDFWTNKARIGVNNGATFGEEGRGFVRMNIGTSRSVLEQAMAQLKEAYEKL